MRENKVLHSTQTAYIYIYSSNVYNSKTTSDRNSHDGEVWLPVFRAQQAQAYVSVRVDMLQYNQSDGMDPQLSTSIKGTK